MKRVAVIGAGAAGLCCARHLSKFPETFQFTVFEQSEQVGGVWVYSNPSPGQLPKDVREFEKSQEVPQTPYRSSMYKNLRTNLPKEIMLFPGLPIDNNNKSFLHHMDIKAYLEKYTDHYKLNQFIQFRTLVEQVSPVPLQPNPEGTDQLDSVKWRVTTRCLATGEMKTEEFDFVFVCSGHFFAPHVPELDGLSTFPRPVIHSHLYREPEPFTSQAVLVVGAGPSGLDITLDLSAHAQVVYLCSRKEPLKTDLPSNVEWVPGISELREDGRVCFEDGQEVKVDSIVLATGYLYSYPFLTEESGIKVVQGKRVTYLYKHTFNVAHPSMAMVGVNSGYIPFPASDLQVPWILSVWQGDKTLPAKQEMIEDVEDTYQSRLEEGLSAHRAAHFLQEKQWALYDQYASFGGLEPMAAVIKMLYNRVCQRRRYKIMEFRRENYHVMSEDTFCVLEDNLKAT